MAEQAVASLAVLALLGEEAPVDGDPAWVAHDGLDHAPDQEYEEQVEDHKQDDVGRWLDGEHELEHVDVVVE